MNAAFIVVLLMCMTGMIVGAALSGEALLEGSFGDLEAPTGAISGLVFAWDLLVGLGKFLVAMLTWDFGFPPVVRFALAGICDTVIVVTVVGLFK